jgi:hypothetical protein
VTTEDEVMRLLRRADPDRAPTVAPSTDGEEYLAALRTRRTTMTLVDTEATTPPPDRRHRWPIIAGAAAVVAAVVVGGLVVAARDDDPTSEVAAPPSTAAAPTTAAPPAAVAQPPVEFTACIEPGPVAEEGTVQPNVVPLSDGDMTIMRDRGTTYRQSLTEVSDPRLEGTLYQAWDEDDYTLPGSVPSANLSTFTDRIENDQGAWQGSAVMLRFPDGQAMVGPLVMAGEGAYEGLTAIVGFESFFESCTVRGYIIEGDVPAIPVPQTGQ